MNWAALALLAAGLGGCATLADEHVDYRCIGTASAPNHEAASMRIVDARGRVRSASTHWMKRGSSDILDVYANWDGADPPPTLARATFRFHFHYGFPANPGRLVLSTEAGEFEGAWSTGDLRTATLTGHQLALLLRDGETILIALLNRSGQLMGSTGIEAADFVQGQRLAREAATRSQAASKDYRRQCRRQPTIVAA